MNCASPGGPRPLLPRDPGLVVVSGGDIEGTEDGQNQLRISAQRGRWQ